MRLFFALPLPDAPRQRLAELKTDLGKARWVSREQLHVTMRFLGEVDEDTAARVVAEVEAERARQPFPALRFAVRGLGFFGGARHPRVLWAAIDPAEPVRRIAEQLERAVEAAGLPRETRPFTAHVTLARLTRPRVDRVTAFLREHATFATETFDVPELILYRSTLTSSGAVHEPIHRFAAGAP